MRKCTALHTVLYDMMMQNDVNGCMKASEQTSLNGTGKAVTHHTKETTYPALSVCSAARKRM